MFEFTKVPVSLVCEEGLMPRSLLFSPVPTHPHAHTPSYSPSNIAGPTPTMMIDMGREEACGESSDCVSHMLLWAKILILLFQIISECITGAFG